MVRDDTQRRFRYVLPIHSSHIAACRRMPHDVIDRHLVICFPAYRLK